MTPITHGGLTFRNHPLAYWIDVVTHQASPDSPVLIVQNKCDQKDQEERRFPVSEEALKALQYVTELHVSPKTDRGRGALEEALQDAILWMRDPNRLGLPQIGAGRLRVQRRLEAMRDADMALPREQRRHRLLEREDFEAICAEEGGVSSPALLLDYLDANGTVFYRPGMFFDRIVLDQGWALDAIYAVFDRKRVYKVVNDRDGRISRAELGWLVWQEHSDSEQKLLLSMMVSCGICFLHRRFGGRGRRQRGIYRSRPAARAEGYCRRAGGALGRRPAGRDRDLPLRSAAWRTDPVDHGRDRRGGRRQCALLARRLVCLRCGHTQPPADRGGDDGRLAGRDPRPHAGWAGRSPAAKGGRGDRACADPTLDAAGCRGTFLALPLNLRHRSSNFAGAGEIHDAGMVCVLRLG